MDERKNKKKKNGSPFATQIPYIVILLISCVGFFAGVLESSKAEQVEELEGILVEQQGIADLMMADMQYNMDTDSDLIRESERAREEIYVLSLEWIDLLFAGLSSNQTKEINVTHLIPIQSALWRMGTLLNDTLAHRMYVHFEIQAQMEPFHVATKQADQYDYNITRELWMENKEELYNIVPALFLLNVSIVDSGFPDTIDCVKRILNDAPKYFFLPNLPFINRILHDPYFKIKGDIWEAEGDLSRITAGESQVSLGVSITTVAVVLSTAMSNRVEKEYIISRISSEISDDKEKQKFRSDKLSMGILLFALIISMLALLLMFMPELLVF